MSSLLKTKFDQPALYEISIKGFVESGLMEIINPIECLEDFCLGGPISSLKVLVKDQAQLSGILNALYDSRLTILKVELSINQSFSN